MNWLQRVGCLFWGGIFVIGVVVTLVLIVAPWCESQVLADVVAPGGRQRAMVIARDCGRPEGVSTQVSVTPSWMPAWLRAKASGNVLVLDRFDSGKGIAPAGPGGGPRVTPRWHGPYLLELRYDARAREVGARPPTDGKTEVRFVVDSI